MQSEDKRKTQRSTRVAARLRDGERERETRCKGEDGDGKMAAADSSVHSCASKLSVAVI